MARKRRPEFVFGSGSFLDVLCNMVGILIILIAVVGMRVADSDDPVLDAAAEETTSVEAPAPQDDREATLAARRLQIEAREKEIAARVAERQRELAEHEREALARQAHWQQLLADMQSRNQQLMSQAKTLQQQIREEAALAAAEDEKRLKLAGMVAAAADQNSDLRKNETELQQQALDLFQRRKELNEEIEARKVARAIRKPVFQIVARDGNSGTIRRPILIECREDGLEFASEKINLSAKDLSEFGPDYNPLLAGAEALLTYWTLVDAQEGETKHKPYLLLVVRPGGTVGYYVARKYLDALNQDYGYELVPEGTEIQWPAADPQAVEVCRRAVEDVLKGPRGSVARRFGSGLRSNSGEVGDAGSGMGPASRYKDTQQIVGSNGNFQLPEVEELRKSSPRDSIGMLGPEWSPQRQRLAASRRPGVEQDQPSSELAAAMKDVEAAARGGQTRELPEVSDEDAGPSRRSEQEAMDQSQKGRGTGRRLMPAALSNASASAATDSGLNRRSGESPGGDALGSRIVPPSPDEALRSQGTASAGGRFSSSPKERPDMPANPVVEASDAMPRDGGRDRPWGQGRRSGAIGIEREIIMHLYAERILITNGSSADLPPGMGREDFHKLIAAMIQVEANSWGEAPSKFTWRPRLKIQIHPGGNQHYGRLKELLEHWGLSSKVEHVLD